MLTRDKEKAEALLAQAPEALRATLRSSGGPSWAYQAHYLLWQPATYFYFFEGKPQGSRIDQVNIGRWVRATFGVNQVLWRLFRAQWQSRDEARKRGYKRHSKGAWFFTSEENDRIPDFYEPINTFVDGLIRCGVIDLDQERPGELVIRSISSTEERPLLRQAQTPPLILPPLRPDEKDPFLGRRISHRVLGVGEVRERLTKSSPTYNVWFNGARWRKVWLGNPADGTWRVLDDQLTHDVADVVKTSPDADDIFS
jgi:hypothetical protein